MSTERNLEAFSHLAAGDISGRLRSVQHKGCHRLAAHHQGQQGYHTRLHNLIHNAPPEPCWCWPQHPSLKNDNASCVLLLLEPLSPYVL